MFHITIHHSHSQPSSTVNNTQNWKKQQHELTRCQVYQVEEMDQVEVVDQVEDVDQVEVVDQVVDVEEWGAWCQIKKGAAGPGRLHTLGPGSHHSYVANGKMSEEQIVRAELTKTFQDYKLWSSPSIMLGWKW